MTKLGWQLKIDCVSCGQLKDYTGEIPDSVPETATKIVGRCSDCEKQRGPIEPIYVEKRIEVRSEHA